jgi:Tfp pilus assembly protein PilX
MATQRLSRASFIAARRRRGRQRGVVLFVAMVAILALTLAGLALDRAVTTDAAVAANLGARTQAGFLATEAIERAVAALFESGAIADRTLDDSSQNYFASRQPGEDGRGVPRALQSIGAYPTGAVVIEAPDRHSVRYVIERLCRGSGPAPR